MAHLHPIHQANENSPYGDLSREDFYKKHHLLHHQNSMVNNQNMKIFTQSWRPVSDSTPQLRGLVAMIHGFASENSWLFELTAVAIAKAGFFVCALDLQGHGYSDGLPGQVPSMNALVDDCIHYFKSVQAENLKLPAFLYGESLGGAIAMLLCLKQRSEWNGLILSGAMCGVSSRFRPVWPRELGLSLVAFFAPTWSIVSAKTPVSKSFKEEWKRKMVAKNPNRVVCGKPNAVTALEMLRACDYMHRNCHKLEVKVLILHGGDDKVCDPECAKFVYESAASTDKSLKILEGMWHTLIAEPNDSVELVFGTIMSWIEERADKFNSSAC